MKCRVSKRTPAARACQSFVVSDARFIRVLPLIVELYALRMLVLKSVALSGQKSLGARGRAIIGMSVTNCRRNAATAGAACAPSAASCPNVTMPRWVDSATAIAEGRVYGFRRDARYWAARTGRSASHRVYSCFRSRQRPGPLGSTCRIVNPSGRSSIRWFGVRNRRCQLKFAVDPKRRLYERALQPCSSASRDPLLVVNSSHCSIMSFQSAATAVSTGGPKGREPGGGENSAQRSAPGGAAARPAAGGAQAEVPAPRAHTRAAGDPAPALPPPR